MPSIKLTKRSIERIDAPDPSGKQTLYWDTDLKGFGLLISGTSNSKTYVVQRRLKDGRTRRLTIGPANVFELDKARELAEAQLGELYLGKDPKAQRSAKHRITLRSALDQYLEARATLRQSSRDNYRQAIQKRLEDWLDKPVLAITAEMVIERHREVQSEIEIRETARRKADDESERRIPITGHATANSMMRALRAVWNFAYDRARRADPDMGALFNPVVALRQERAWFPAPRRDTFVRADQLPEFYKAVSALPNRIGSDYIKLLLFTGLRRTEAAELRWDDVDFAARVIRLPGVRTKNGSKLNLPMTDFVSDLIVARRALGRDGDYVFPGNGKSDHLAEPKSFLNEVAEACGVRVGAHDLRRTFITVAADVAISPMALKALVNHSLGGDVTEGYARLTTEQLRRPAQMICDRMKELCAIETPSAENVTKLVQAITG